MISLLHSKRKIKITDTVLLNMYDFIDSILKLLIYTNSVEKKLGQRFLEIASLPWLRSIDPPWFDFEPTFFNQYDLLQLYNLTKSSNEKLIQKKSLKIMSVLPRYSESPAWIIHVVQYTLVSFFILVLILFRNRLPNLIHESIPENIKKSQFFCRVFLIFSERIKSNKSS